MAVSTEACKCCGCRRYRRRSSGRLSAAAAAVCLLVSLFYDCLCSDAAIACTLTLTAGHEQEDFRSRVAQQRKVRQGDSAGAGARF